MADLLRARVARVGEAGGHLELLQRGLVEAVRVAREDAEVVPRRRTARVEAQCAQEGNARRVAGVLRKLDDAAPDERLAPHGGGERRLGRDG